MLSLPKKNESATDRLLRGILGILLLEIAYVWLYGAARIAVSVIGVIVLFTALTGFCALYTFLGISTRKKKRS